VKALSGGERGRLMLARALARPANLLILDEPTNDLDLETLDVLQEMLTAYAGTLILVSHDRDFLDRTVTSVVASEGNGVWTEYAGGYSDMVAQRGHGVGAVVRAKPSPEREKPAPRPRAPRQKLTFSDQHALKSLPGRIAALSAEIGRLEGKLSETDFYARDPAGFGAAGRALDTARGELAAAEDEWLRIELLREEIEGA
jgi:ATP-binding cassette subfamily F protein uup